MSPIISYFMLGMRYAVMVAALTGAIYAVVLARASALYEQDTATSLNEAVHLVPNNSAYLDRLANWQPEQREALLRRSVELDPFDYDAWTRLGLLAEMQEGDSAAAEKDFLKAAEVNHMFMPRWTLTNFYFREQNIPEFFRWSKLALDITSYSSDPIFAQMWLVTQDENTLNSVIPNRPRILLQYAWYLANNKQYGPIPRAVARLISAVGKSDPRDWGRDDLLAIAEDRMLAAGFVSPAIKVWASLNSGGWIKQTVPDDQRPLTNGDFRLPFYRHGFDWTTVDDQGVRVDQVSGDASVRINLFGDQGDKVVLMQEYVDVQPGKNYSMSWQARGQDLADPSGVAWHLHPIKGGAEELVSGDLLATHSWSFEAPEDAKAFLLTLECERPLGNMRARGMITLQTVSMNQK